MLEIMKLKHLLFCGGEFGPGSCLHDEVSRYRGDLGHGPAARLSRARVPVTNSRVCLFTLNRHRDIADSVLYASTSLNTHPTCS
jgi:hypothetical protein